MPCRPGRWISHPSLAPFRPSVYWSVPLASRPCCHVFCSLLAPNPRDSSVFNIIIITVIFLNIGKYCKKSPKVVGPFQLPAPQSGTLSWILSVTRPSVQTVSGVCLKRICSLDTSAFSALEVPDDNCAL